MMRREAEARKGVEEARLAVIRACGELRESEMFLSAVMADERSAVGSAASAADVANTHRSNLREQVQPRKVLHADSSPEEYAESQLIEAASALQKAVLVLGLHNIRHWFDEGLLARAQSDMLQIQVAPERARDQGPVCLSGGRSWACRCRRCRGRARRRACC